MLRNSTKKNPNAERKILKKKKKKTNAGEMAKFFPNAKKMKK